MWVGLPANRWQPARRTAVESIKRILYLIHQRMGHDFSQYKPETVRRRVERRMAVNQIASVDDYLRFLQQDGAETEILFRELLIGVTSFFRDPEAFDLLRYDVLPAILVMLPPGDPIRAWVPGCATGEEAYSIAILVQEALEEAGIYREVQIFATDVDSLAIDKARSRGLLGQYRRGRDAGTAASLFHARGEHVPRRLARA